MLRLYTHDISIMPWRVRIALHEKGLEYAVVETDLITRPASPEFLTLNPFGQIPVLEDGSLVLAESMAILEYLEEKHPAPPLLPADLETRATARKWMGWSTDVWPRAWKQWMAGRLGRPTTEESTAAGRRALAHHLDTLAIPLAETPWLVGDYSLADVCYAPLVLVLEHAGFAEEIETRPAVASWVQRLKQRRAIQEAGLARR